MEYNDDSIKSLDWKDAIRRRPGMYIGRLGDGNSAGDGIYVLLKETVDNSIDEFRAGNGRNIIINVTEQDVYVRDFGRGIPLNKVIDVTSKLHTGAKFDSEVFVKSVGLNGVGLKAVNALSTSFYAESFRDGESAWVEYSRGELVGSGKRDNLKEKNGTLVRFTPDAGLFVGYKFKQEIVETLIKNYSYLNKGLTLTLNGIPHVSKNGLLDLVNDNLTEATRYEPIHLESPDIEIVMTHGDGYGENIASFVNGQNTRDGGTHLAAFREAVAKTVKEFYKKEYDPADIRMGIIGAVSIRIQEPNFEGQTKTKLGSTYIWEKEIENPDKTRSFEHGPTIRSFINDFVAKNLDNYLHIHKEIVPALQEKILSSEAERKEISDIQKKTREHNKRANIYNKKLHDCRFHFNDKRTDRNSEDIERSSIFITEGDSASGTIIQARSANYQAVFSLRGKPINCYKESRKKVAENEELNLLISALGIEEDIDNLRYNNIIVATDADDDGMHIRMLVLTFFLKYHPDLIRRGHVHILQTPLFRVRNKTRNIYCYSSEEKQKAMDELKSGYEITRFKGLGEISKGEFANFIGSDIRLDQVTLADEESISDIMGFYMGENTPERQHFIREHLRSEEELEDIDI